PFNWDVIQTQKQWEFELVGYDLADFEWSAIAPILPTGLSSLKRYGPTRWFAIASTVGARREEENQLMGSVSAT
ncbi:MAG: hypothetical protein QGG84_08935, partial [Rhodospirillales bacterium]|nr:hypothetical protein [Rhodospirillales bacterium]